MNGLRESTLLGTMLTLLGCAAAPETSSSGGGGGPRPPLPRCPRASSTGANYPHQIILWPTFGRARRLSIVSIVPRNLTRLSSTRTFTQSLSVVLRWTPSISGRPSSGWVSGSSITLVSDRFWSLRPTVPTTSTVLVLPQSRVSKTTL